MKPLAIADLFCGAGGTSAGAVEAMEMLGYTADLTAINHWPTAIATHTANHPEARHLCTGLDTVDPRTLFKPGELQLLWASPECTHHSVARGGKPINDQSRATAWCVVRWAEALMPPVILVENVPEFETWGGICANGRPMKSKKGATFLAWAGALESLGYTVDWRVLCAADYGDPTTRRRLFVQAVRGRRKIVWPEPTHAPKESTDLFGKRKAWVPARDIIDWSLQGQSVYERKRPLSPKTMRRIMAGLEKFGLKPFIVPGFGERAKQAPRTHDVEQPMPTVAAQGHAALAEPWIVRPAHGNDDATSDLRHNHPISDPLGVVPCSNEYALAQPFLVQLRGTDPQQVKNSAKSLDHPAPTLTTSGAHLALAEPFIIPQHGLHPARSVDQPAPTVTTTSRGVGLAQPFLITMEHGGSERSVDRPMPTITTAKGGAIGVAQPFLIHTAHGKERPAHEVGKPAPTVTGNRGDLALIEPGLLPQHGGGALRPVDDPAPTIATDGAVTAKDRFGLARPVVIVNGERYLLDIEFRMLQPHELAGAQGFRKGYIFTGNKSDQVKQIGNAVPRRLSRAIVVAVLSQRSDVAEIIERWEQRQAA